MRLVRGLLPLLLVAIGGSASAAPPPPAVYPADFPKRVSGYDLQPIYAVYHSWVGRGRQPALAKALGDGGKWQGKTHWGSLAESEIQHYDYGIVRMDRLDRYCLGEPIESRTATECELRYRYAFVPGSLDSDDRREKRTRDSFRPRVLAVALARAGWKQKADTDHWTDPQLQRLFERHTDLEALYGPMVELHEVGSSSFRGFSKAVSALDTMSLALSPAAPSTDEGFPVHGQQTQIRLTARTADGGAVVLEGARPLYPKMEPIWTAVEACAKR